MALQVALTHAVIALQTAEQQLPIARHMVAHAFDMAEQHADKQFAIGVQQLRFIHEQQLVRTLQMAVQHRFTPRQMAEQQSVSA